MSDRLVVKYEAKWCGSCKQVQPLLESVAAEFGAKIRHVDIEEYADEARAMDIRAIPTIVLYEGDDIKVKRPGIGSVSPANLREVFIAAYGDKL